MNEEHTIKLGVIGLGNIARLHCDRLQKAGHGDLLAAGLDVDPDARDRFAAQYDATVYERQADLYADVDAVLVTTPNKFHEEYVVDANYLRRRGVPGRGSWFTRKALAGGGALIDIGVHAIDLSLYMLGFPDVVEVSGQTRATFGTRPEYAYVNMWGEDHGPAGFDVDDSASAFIRCADGSTISLEVAWASNRPDSQEYVARGSEAGARLDLSNDEMELYETVSSAVDHHRTSAIETAGDDAHGTELVEFVESVAAGDPPGTNTIE